MLPVSIFSGLKYPDIDKLLAFILPVAKTLVVSIFIGLK